MVIDRDFGMKKLIEQLASLQNAPAVFVGVLGDEGSEEVTIAAVHEFGSETQNIPERAPIRTTMDENEQEILDDLTNAVGSIFDGTSQEQALGLVGEKWVGKIKQRIVARLEPPLAEKTIADKGSDVPLIDEGRLRNSYTYVVRAGEGA